jgi:hypothetical protein
MRLGHSGRRNKQAKYAESRYSKGFETSYYHTYPEICRKDKEAGVKTIFKKEEFEEIQAF